MEERLRQLEKKLKEQELEINRLKEESKIIYPYRVNGKEYVSATHWYYCEIN